MGKLSSLATRECGGSKVWRVGRPEALQRTAIIGSFGQSIATAGISGCTRFGVAAFRGFAGRAAGLDRATSFRRRRTSAVQPV
jgi:hypothetical protein